MKIWCKKIPSIESVRIINQITRPPSRRQESWLNRWKHTPRSRVEMWYISVGFSQESYSRGSSESLRWALLVVNRVHGGVCAEKWPGDLCVWPDDRDCDPFSVCSCVTSPSLYKLLGIKGKGRFVKVRMTQDTIMPTGIGSHPHISSQLATLARRSWQIWSESILYHRQWNNYCTLCETASRSSSLVWWWTPSTAWTTAASGGQTLAKRINEIRWIT